MRKYFTGDEQKQNTYQDIFHDVLFIDDEKMFLKRGGGRNASPFKE
jgi:hypothetical protein